MKHRKRFVASVVMLALALAPAALAAKGGPKTNAATAAAISLSAGPYNFGGTVSVTTGVSPDLMPWVSMSCTQNGAVVGTATHAGFAGGSYYGTPFNLGPSMSWTGGAADCTFSVVHLSGGKVVTDASAAIHVDA
jgi:peptidoglycan/LPS O-acetylase OafA/YrhL